MMLMELKIMYYQKINTTIMKKDYIKSAKITNLLGDSFNVETGKNVSRENRLILGQYEIMGANGCIGYTNKYLINKKCIITGRVGTIGGLSLINKKIWPSDNVLIISEKDHTNSIDFLYYYLKTVDFKTLNVGSTQPLITQTDIKNLPIDFPPNNEQIKIAEILSSLDDKIELNRRINDNLEAVASALFKRWFIDFEFPDKNGQPYKNNNGKMLTSELGPIPDGWSINQAQELFDFTKGIEPGNKNYTPIESEITIPFFRVADLFNGNQSKTYIDESIAGTAIMNNNDVLIATDGTVGRVATGLYGSYSGGIKKVISKDKSISNSFIYFWLKSSIVQDKLKEYASNATTIAHASGAIKDLKIAYNKEIIKKFCVLSQPIFEEITNNLSENIKIKKVIDLLLPRMLSGKIKV